MSKEFVLALATREQAEPIAVADIRTAARTLEEIVRCSLGAQAQTPATCGAGDAPRSDSGDPDEARLTPVGCLQLLADVWRHPMLRGVVSQRFLPQELGALIRLAHEAATPAGEPSAQNATPAAVVPTPHRSGQPPHPVPEVLTPALTGAAASGARLGNAHLALSPSGAGGDETDGATHAAEWVAGRLSQLLDEELLVPLLEALVHLVRSPASPQWLRSAAAAHLSQTVQRQGGAQALLLCLRDSSAAGEGAAAGGGASRAVMDGGGSAGTGVQPATALAVRLLSTPPQGAAPDDYFRGMCAQAAQLLLPPPTASAQAGPSVEAGGEAQESSGYLRSAGAQLCAAIAAKQPRLAQRWLLAPLLALVQSEDRPPDSPRAALLSTAGAPADAAAGAASAAQAGARRRLHALLCAAPPPPQLCDALLASGALAALLDSAPPASAPERLAARESLCRLLLGASAPASAFEALLLRPDKPASTPSGELGLVRRVRAELRPPELRAIGAALLVALLRRALLAVGANVAADPSALERLQSCLVRPQPSQPHPRTARRTSPGLTEP